MKITPFSRLDPAGSPLPINEKAGPAGGRDAVSLNPGQLLKCRVLRVEENGRVLLSIDDELVTARTPLKLEAGSEHWLEVRRGGTEPWLALAGQKGAAAELLRLLAGEEGGRGKVLELLLAGSGSQDQLSPPAFSPLQQVAGLLAESAAGGEPDPARIILALMLLQPAGTKEEGGLLRRRLSELQAVLPEGAPARKGAEKLARLFGAVEELNGQPPAAGERFFVFPCLLAGTSGWGEWLLNPDESQGASGEAGYGLAFFLHLSRLGELHLQLTVHGGAVRGAFATASGAARQHLEICLPELTAALHGLGFGEVHLACRQAERHLLLELQEAIRRQARMAPLALVDLRA
ncbi:MAG: hypothetical protein M0017_01155 [Desulfobacteraceae bacterium]|nr:hypothetical protein [Desulfobacteraceae bacterium]